jgi:hypothetical protein
MLLFKLLPIWRDPKRIGLRVKEGEAMLWPHYLWCKSWFRIKYLYYTQDTIWNPRKRIRYESPWFSLKPWMPEQHRLYMGFRTDSGQDWHGDLSYSLAHANSGYFRES